MFLLVFPFLLIPIMDKRRYNWTGVINRFWARVFMTLIFIPFKVEYEEKLDKKKRYILCPNHFSYLDIPIMGLVNLNTIFVGKSSLENIPLFGWMYKKLHITVDRNSLKSKYSTYLRSIETLEEGKNLTIFPEGGILSTNPPQMARFKDGAFKCAVNTNTPLVPVTIVNNWIVMPEDFLMKWSRIKVIVHKPIQVDGYTEKDISILKEKVFTQISKTL